MLTRSARDLWFKGVLPGLGGLMLLYFFCSAAFDVYADPNYGHTSMTLPLLGKVGGVSVVGLASLLLGVVLMLVQWAVQGSWFRSPDVPTGAHAAESGPAGEPEAAPAT